MTNFGRISAFFIALVLLGSVEAWAAILYTNANETPLNTGASNPVDSGTIKRLNDSCVLQDPQSYTHSETQHVRRVTAPVRAGTYAQVQLVQKGCDYRSSNPDLRQKPRVGMVPKKTVIDMNEGEEFWLHFSVYFDTDFQIESNSANPDNLLQVFKEDNRNNGASAFDVELIQGNIILKSRNTGASATTIQTYSVAVTKGQWYDITLNAKLQKPGGTSGGFYDWYVNYPGYATPSVSVLSGTGINTEADQHSFALNLYKYAGYCTSEYQLNAAQCPYSTATGYPAATTNSTNWTGQRKVYFDEFRIGDSGSSLAEIAPHVYDTPVDPPDTGITIIGHNSGQSLEPSDDPVYFTASGGSVVGCVKVEITDVLGTTVTMPKCNTNATGGRYTADALSTLINGAGTFELFYDAPLFDTSTMTNSPVNWTGTNTATPTAYTNGSELLDFGYTAGVKITNSGTAGVIAPATGDRVTIADGAAATARFVFSPDTDTQVKAQVQTSSGTVEYSGTLGNLTLTQSTTGTGHDVDEWNNNGFYYVDINFTANNAATPTTYRLAAGAKNNGPNKSIIWWDGKLWSNLTPETASYYIQISKPDTIAPSPSDCQISAINTTTFNLGCALDDYTGTFYSVISTSATAPSLAQVKAGQDHSGATALWSLSQPATSGTFTTTALNPYAQKCAYFAQTDAGANDSVVVSGEACIDAESISGTKKIKFSDDKLKRGANYLTCVGSCNIDHFKVYARNPLVYTGEPVLAHWQSVQVSAGVAELTESTIFDGSVNALLPDVSYWWFLFDEDKDPLFFGEKTITVE